MSGSTWSGVAVRKVQEEEEEHLQFQAMSSGEKFSHFSLGPVALLGQEGKVSLGMEDGRGKREIEDGR